MSVYRTEEEQLQAIKKWWQRYNGLIITSISIVLLVIAGFRYWNWHKSAQKEQASTAYEHLMVAFSNKDNKVIKSYANQIITNFNHTVYADIAHLSLAKVYVGNGKLNKAITELEQVAATATIPALKQVAKIRLARLLASKKSYTDALNALNSVDDAAYNVMINELKGDIYAMTGEYQKAISFYKLAMNEAKSRSLGNLFLEMKTNELAALT